MQSHAALKASRAACSASSAELASPVSFCAEASAGFSSASASLRKAAAPGLVSMKCTSTSPTRSMSSGVPPRVKVARGGGTPVTLASGQHTPDGIPVDTSSVHWIQANSSSSPGAVMKLTPK